MGMRSTFYAPFLAMVLGLMASCRDAPARIVVPAPPLVLWAWERAEDLRFLSSQPAESVGVAYLHATLILQGPAVILHRRAASLQLPAGIWLTPVVRIETDRAPSPTLSAGQRQELLRVLLVELQRAGSSRLQIDFEAKASQRAFYRQLLVDLRAQLGPRFPISVTALASFCLTDRWMYDLPVDEIVPTFYRLGNEGPRLRSELSRGIDVAPECRRAHGLSTDEPMTAPPSPRRLYLFAPTAWTPESLQVAREKLNTGHTARAE